MPQARVTTEDCQAAHVERLAENEKQLRENQFYCIELDRRACIDRDTR